MGCSPRKAEDDLARLDKERVWIVDPLGWNSRSVSLAGLTGQHACQKVNRKRRPNGRSRCSSWAIERTLSTDPAPQLPAPHGGRPKMVVSRSRAPAAAMIVAEALDAELFVLGPPAPKQWRSCSDTPISMLTAGVSMSGIIVLHQVALAAGLHASRCDGSPLDYNYEDPGFQTC